MSDDLVARLRTITVADSANIIYKTMAEAADEIERLRARIKELEAECRRLERTAYD